MGKAVILAAIFLLVLPGVTGGEEASGGEVLGAVKALNGDVKIGEGDLWRTAAVGDELVEGQLIRTGAGAGAEILFSGEIPATLGENTTIGVSDLLLKARLEKMRNRVSEPADTRKVDMQVTPTAGVRGTEQTEEKAEDLKREHYWNEGAK